ncbi:MAG: hypothetical protein Q8R30_00945 [bacterium]|nr:hypothetical protein [bacterium]
MILGIFRAKKWILQEAILFVFFWVLFFTWTSGASAATLFLSSSGDVFHIGDTFDVVIKTDTEGVGINAAQAVLQFPKDILQITKVDKAYSVFNFWLEEPSISNETGRLTFTGGSTAGESGKSLQILKVTFAVKGSGRAELTFTDGAISASDGSGTNVLSTLNSLVINSIPKTGVSESPATATSSAVSITQIPKPVQISRTPVPASRLPSKPDVTIPLYPDSQNWYSGTTNFIAQWKLPPDVSGVSTAIDRNINYVGETSEGLFDSKVFPTILKDGIWYLHVRFKNNIGWGTANNYRIAIDTLPPLAFTTSIREGQSTDNPTPTLQFKTSDALSGLKEYGVKIDNNEAIRIPSAGFLGTFALPLQIPGAHVLYIQAVDGAGNSVEDKTSVEIIPIQSPTINFVTKNLFSEEQQGLTIKGTALPDITILLQVRGVAEGDGEVAAKTIAQTDDKGNWGFTFDQPLRNGQYVVTAQAQDQRGALSIIVTSDEIQVNNKPIIQFGSLQLGKGGAAFLLLLIMTLGFGGGIWFYKTRQEKISLRVSLAQSEVTKLFKLIMEDVERLSKAYQTSTSADDEYAMAQLKGNIKKMEGYLKKGIEKIRK